MSDPNQEKIVQRMIDAGESEDNIATVIKSFKPNQPGNIDVTKQPQVSNPNGGTSTVFSKSYNIDGKETLLPSVTPDGRFLKTDEDVINEYKKTGRHLGQFNSPEEANQAAQKLHESEANRISQSNFQDKVTKPNFNDVVSSHSSIDKPNFSNVNSDTPNFDNVESDNSSTNPKQGILSKVYHYLMDPTTDLPTRAAKGLTQVGGDWTDPNQMLISPTGRGGVHDYAAGVAARLRGFEAGAVEGAGKLGTDMSSLGNLALLLLSGGTSTAEEAGYGGLSSALNIGSKIASAPVIGHGAYQTLNPESSWSDRVQGLIEMAGGGAAALHTPNVRTGEVPPRLPDIVKFTTEPTPIPESSLWDKTKTAVKNFWNDESGSARFEKDKPIIPEPSKSTGRKLAEEVGFWGEKGEPKSDLMSDFLKTQKKEPTPAGTPWLDSDGKTIGHTTDNNGSTGFIPLNESLVPRQTGLNTIARDMEILTPDQYTHMGDVNTGSQFGNTKRVTSIEMDPEHHAAMRENWGNMSKEEINRSIELQSAMSGPLEKITPEMHDEYVALQKKRPGTPQPDQYLLKQEAEQRRLKNVADNKKLYAPKPKQLIGFVDKVKNFLTDEDASAPVPEIYFKKLKTKEQEGTLTGAELDKLTEMRKADRTVPITEDNIKFSTKEEADLAKPAVDIPKTTSASKSGEFPKGTIVTIKHGPDTPTKVQQAMKAGFEYDSIDKDGNFRFKKTSEATSSPVKNETLDWNNDPQKKVNQAAKYAGSPEYAGKISKARAMKAANSGNKPPVVPPTSTGGPPPIEPINPKKMNPIIQRIQDKTPEQDGIIREVWNLSKGLMSVDLPFITSAAFRQGHQLIGTKAWLEAWAPSVKAYGSKAAFEANNALIKADDLVQRPTRPVLDKLGNLTRNKEGRPIFKEEPSILERMGVHLADIIDKEETIRSSLAERIPIYGKMVAANNRSYIAWINQARLGAARNFYEAMPDKNNEVALKQLGDAVNAFTGRGKLTLGLPESTSYFGKRYSIPGGGNELSLEKYAKPLADIFWAPKLMASRMQALNPVNYLALEPQVRKEYLKAALRSAGTWATLAGLAKLSGIQVSLDPTSSDFGKIKIGNTRLDPAGGFQQWIVLNTRLATGESTSSTSGKTSELGHAKGPYDPTYGSVIGGFLANKLTPRLKQLYDAAYASKSRPYHIIERELQQWLPMISGDLIQIGKEQPELLPMLAPVISAGIGAQTYEKGEEFNKPVISPFIQQVTGLPMKEHEITLGR